MESSLENRKQDCNVINIIKLCNASLEHSNANGVIAA